MFIYDVQLLRLLLSTISILCFLGGAIGSGDKDWDFAQQDERTTELENNSKATYTYKACAQRVWARNAPHQINGQIALAKSLINT